VQKPVLEIPRRDQGLLGHFRIIDHGPQLGLLRVEFGEFAPVMGLDILIGVAPQGVEVGPLCRLLGDPHDTADGRERMMAQPERDNLFFAYARSISRRLSKPGTTTN
jgi:hypothetical protein